MNWMTVWGVVGREGGVATTSDDTGAIVEVRSYTTFEPRLPVGDLIVDVDHEGPAVGKALHVEISDNGVMHAVCVVDPDAVAELRQPIHFSGLFSLRGDKAGTVFTASARLLALSLTERPASLEARLRPLAVIPGHLIYDHGEWPCDWRSREPLLRRAHERRAEPLRYVHRSSGHGAATTRAAWVEGGRVEHGAAAGRIIAVQ